MIISKYIHVLCLSILISASNGTNILEKLMKFFFRQEDGIIREKEIDLDSMALLPIKIGFEPGVNRLRLIGENFPLLKINDYQNLNIYTYVCMDKKDEICDWETFKNIISKNDRLLWRYDIIDLKLIHTFIVCESLQGQHKLCPNPCSQKNICADMKYCAPTFWGLYKTDYMCLCADNHVWNDDLKECLLYDTCYWKSGVSCSSKPGETCWANDDGTYKCVSEAYRNMHTNTKVCEYKCENTIDIDCIHQLSYFYHRIENEHNICGKGECVVNSTASNGFICICEEGWIDDDRNKYSDCSIDTRTDCYDKKFTCINGECEWNPDEKSHTCNCSKGYDGESCNVTEPAWLPWQSWSPCHADCYEDGIRVRLRECSGDLALCRKPRKEPHFNEEQFEECHRNCNNKLVDLYFTWNTWSDCESFCENHDFKGRRSRQRVCVNSNSSYECQVHPEIDYQYEDCFHVECSEKEFLETFDNKIEINQKNLLSWTDWSDCRNYDNDCNYGYQYRFLSCGHHMNMECEFTRIEVQSCINLCKNSSNYPWSLWTKWSKCSLKNICHRERYCYGLGCAHEQGEYQKVDRQHAPCINDICQPLRPSSDLNYIWQRQGPTFTKAYFMSSSESNQTIYLQMNSFIQEAFKTVFKSFKKV